MASLTAGSSGVLCSWVASSVVQSSNNSELSERKFFSGPRVGRNPPSVKANARNSARQPVRATLEQATVENPETTYSQVQSKEKDDVRLVKITDDTLSLRGRCQERLKFEVEYGLRVGTTENSYIISGPLATVLIDVPDQAFATAFSEAEASLHSQGRAALTHLVLGHVSPKRVDSLIQLASTLPKGGAPIITLCSNPAFQLLSGNLPAELIGAVFDLRAVRTGDTLDLGGGHVLRFIPTPTPRWPDSLATYDPKTQLLFTNKLFSAHICCESDFDVGGWDAYGEHWRFFYDCMVAPVAKQMQAALDKLPVVAQFAPPSYSGKTGLDVVKTDLQFIWSSFLSTLNLDIASSSALLARTAISTDPSEALIVSGICPMHGPIVRTSLTELVREYKQWTSERIRQAEEATVAVIYASAYGNTSALAQAISRGLLRSGVGVETINCEFSPKDEIAAVIKRSCGFVLGSPTLAGHMPTPVQAALGVILEDATAKTKPAGVFGSFGWSGEAIDEIQQRLKDAGFSFAFPAIRCKFKPTDAMLQVCEESGRDLAKSIRKAKAQQAAQATALTSKAAAAASAAPVEQAVGRVVGSLCVVSAVKGDAQSAMLASWVSQASFAPPGITVAVAKERAMESLVLPGCQFALSVLGEGKAGPATKQLLKPFAPGEARFGDLPTREAANGATILTDAIAYLECTVETRMETGDHWVLYASVTGGDLLDDKALTALHHRKTGSRY